ncbi:MAG: response regulator transcription factor [Anaerolineae bacterium]
MSQTILIIEDEARIAHWVQTYFEKAGFCTLLAADGVTGLHLARTQAPDLIILDLMLPGLDGTEICRRLRHDSATPIIMLTARGQKHDRIGGLNLGADDYITKPFDPDELVARAKAVLRRAQGDVTQPELLRGGNICLNLTERICYIQNQPVELTRSQFALLEILMRHQGHVLSRDQLLDALAKDDYDGFDRAIDTQIRRLRQRIETTPAEPRHIITVFGLGYKFME